MAYRSSRKPKRADAPESGVVADMVRQFADRYAFVRELVQNAIDAGATHVAVCAQRRADGTAVWSVEDDGQGMTRTIIEGPLLTLFSSSKENASGKIGKYGVGFVSVFAIEPAEVVVETWREGESWVVRLWPDHRYELAYGRPRAGSGTLVALLQPLDAEQFVSEAGRVRHALVRWCRHVAVPVSYQLTLPSKLDDAEPSPRELINRPLELCAVASVVDARQDEVIVVGPAAGFQLLVDVAASEPSSLAVGEGPAPVEPGSPTSVPIEQSATFAGFYNRGLTLFETAEPVRDCLRGIRFKVQSPALQHTLSRDNVRRDAAYERLVDRVEELVRKRLRPELGRELAAAAARVTAPADALRYAALLTAASTQPTALPLEELVVPLAAPVGGRTTASLDELRSDGGRVFYTSSVPCKVVTALGAADRAVLFAPHPAIVPWVAHHVGASAVRGVDESFLLAQEIPAKQLSDSDRMLCRFVAEALALLDAPVDRVGIADAHGLLPSRPAIRAVHGDRSTLPRSAHEVASWWPGWGRRTDLLLVAQHDLVRRARLRAEHHPLVAAHLLARALWVDERGPVSASANGALLDAARARLPARPADGARAGAPRRKKAPLPKPRRRR